MKIEIEITPEEITKAIDQKVREAIRDQTIGWHFDQYVKDEVKRVWQPAVQKLVSDGLANSDLIREKITLAIEAKIKSQIQALMKVQK